MPYEACGLLVGRWSDDSLIICDAVASQNMCAAEDRFEVDPRLRLHLQRQLREAAGGLSVVGNYHSHPVADAVPSCIDQARADEHGMLWLIVGMRDGDVTGCRGYVSSPHGLVFVPLQVADEKK